MLQENKERQIFRKTNISQPLIRTRAYKGLALKGLNDSNNVSVKTVLYGNPIFDESDNYKILETSIRSILFYYIFYTRKDLVDAFEIICLPVCTNFKNQIDL